MRLRTNWLKERENGIGASDAAAILGMSPWMSNLDLWEIKTGRKQAPDIGDKPYVKFGNEAEEHMRAMFALDFPQFTVNYKPYDLRRNPEYPFIFATLDGEIIENERHGVFENKTARGKWSEWDNRVPDPYYIQVLHQLLATGYGFAILKSRILYEKYGLPAAAIRHYRFEREEHAESLEILLRKELEFWECVESNTPPPLILPSI